ncbi:MAG TPA: hypothetical protein PK718_07735 [Candidatus Methanofastidiosa archaeon]|nr:hypothetical protein [Candidatus Methanofastidiosa archaeon]HPR42414.1 hypothetical protein [Candidatus Methanofastidiosa archaeon]
MSGQLVYISILRILKEHHDRDPDMPVSSGELRSELNTPLDELIPYVEKLVHNGYVFRARGKRSEGSSFLLKIREQGLKALSNRRIEIAG